MVHPWIPHYSLYLYVYRHSKFCDAEAFCECKYQRTTKLRKWNSIVLEKLHWSVCRKSYRKEKSGVQERYGMSAKSLPDSYFQGLFDNLVNFIGIEWITVSSLHTDGMHFGLVGWIWINDLVYRFVNFWRRLHIEECQLRSIQLILKWKKNIPINKKKHEYFYNVFILSICYLNRA